MKFCPLAGQRGGGDDAVTQVAELIYWMITGSDPSDISEKPEAYEPPTYRTRGRLPD